MGLMTKTPPPHLLCLCSAGWFCLFKVESHSSEEETIKQRWKQHSCAFFTICPRQYCFGAVPTLCTLLNYQTTQWYCLKNQIFSSDSTMNHHGSQPEFQELPSSSPTSLDFPGFVLFLISFDHLHVLEIEVDQ